MRARHIAVAAGLALMVALGGAQAGTRAFADTDSAAEAAAGISGEEAVAGSTAAAENPLPAPSDYDKADFYEETPTATALTARASSSLSAVSVSSEMKYFTKYESHSNYRQGFGAGDGYNALGYYQFDRRYSLVSFVTEVYRYNPDKYAMLKAIIDRGSEVKSAESMYDSSTRQLTSLGKLVQDAWYAAYDADPAEFSALQDAYAYNSYYVPTERWLAQQGIDMSGRADCVKGMVWGLSNMWGTGGVRKVLTGAKLSNDMTDREFVTALSKQMTDNITSYSSQTQYYTGWKNRYRNELNDCLAFIALNESENGAGGSDASEDAVGGSGVSDDATGNVPAGDDALAGDDDATVSEDDSNNASGGGAANGSEGSKPVDGTGAGSDADGTAGGADADDDSRPSDGVAGSGDQIGSAAEDGSADDGGVDGERPGASNGILGSVSSGDAMAGTSGSEDEGSDEDAGAASDSDAEASENDSAADEREDGGGESTKGDEPDGAEKEDTRASENAGDVTDGDARDAKAGDSEEGSGADAKGRMPQTSDLIMFTGLAMASAATFGATFIAAGKHGLRNRKDEGADD